MTRFNKGGRMMKRPLAVLLSVLAILFLFPITALAQPIGRR